VLRETNGYVDAFVLDRDLADKIEAARNMDATYQTMIYRAQLAHELFEMSKQEVKSCQQLVHEQHLQQQVIFCALVVFYRS